MRLSTGIILSILSANVFAIEHPNGAHSGSLLARRAVVADTDDPSSSDGAEGSSTDFPDYVHDQDDEDQGARNNVYTGLGSDPRRLSFADASGDSSSRVLGGMMQRLSPAKLGLILLLSKHRASTASNRVKLHFNGLQNEKNPKQQGSSSTLESKERSEIETKPSDDVTSSNAPSEDGVVYDLVSVD
ncbi:hypothetical protein BASA50_003323 [Batrachochytrium salamandrivorans]|uniref:RxLR effector protein n=1 Tax=Batrachochytrium salamandrivorans TaxID=1357716 RepID=A0ABQ8FIW0_9FUNG|nr:hypothetical protein BASA50_003323 [Batrachochytrium salamandrivorans]